MLRKAGMVSKDGWIISTEVVRCETKLAEGWVRVLQGIHGTVSWTGL